jgi:hypothetical protein
MVRVEISAQPIYLTTIEVDLILTGKLMVPNLTLDFIEADLILAGLG